MRRGAKIAVAVSLLAGGLAGATAFRRPAAPARIEAVEASPAAPVEPDAESAPRAPSTPQPPQPAPPAVPRVTLDWPPEIGPEAVLGPPRELPPEEVTSHKVREGETLSGLARKYLGSSERFAELWEANREVVASPQRLRAGVVLRIPRGGATPPRPSDAVPMVPIDKGDWRRAPPGQRGL